MVGSLCIVGGKLQGLEAAYLAKKAGYKTVLIDRRREVPATSLVDEVYTLDVVKDGEEVKRVIGKTDAVLPALEDLQALYCLEKTCRSTGIPYMQDNQAFDVTSDKVKSIELFQRLGIPNPKPWPETGFPVVVKPVHKSGSTAVWRVDSEDSLSQAVSSVLEVDSDYLIQEFVEGLPLSLELLRKGGNVQPLQLTGLEFDEHYGCKRVVAPCVVSSSLKDEVGSIGRKIAEGLGLLGLTDLQVIVGLEGVKVIEINARLPSQTPTVVYNSTNLNMVELLCSIFVDGSLPAINVKPMKAVIYQHVKVANNSMMVVGEHALSDAQGLRVQDNFFGADEAITNISENRKIDGCVTTLIVKDASLRDAKKRMEETIRSIMTESGVSKFSDPSPEGTHRFYDEINP